MQRRALGFLFGFLAFCFFGIALGALAGGLTAAKVVVAAASVALGIWLGSLSVKALGVR